MDQININRCVSFSSCCTDPVLCILFNRVEEYESHGHHTKRGILIRTGGGTHPAFIDICKVLFSRGLSKHGVSSSHV